MVGATFRYNAYFATAAEARLAWALYCLARHGLSQPIPPFPGDRVAAHLVNHRGEPASNIFAALRSANLAEYAGRFTTLRPAGPGKWKGRCPLHLEKTPSFYVYADPWRWRCYGACAQGGDIVALARELQLRGSRP